MRRAMNINLSPEIENFIQSKVKSGFYSNATEVIYDALRHMEEQDERKESESLRTALLVGHDQAERGEVSSYSSELIDKLTQQAFDNAKNNKPIKDNVRP